MIDRRKFLKSVAAGTAAFAVRPDQLFGRSTQSGSAYFGIHPTIEANPDAVFILRTAVDVKTNSEAKKQVGAFFGSSVFQPMTAPGFPMTSRVVMKPNIAMMPNADQRYMGIVTDVYFVEGIIESLKNIGLAGNQMFVREISGTTDFANSGYLDMAARTGVDLRDLNRPIEYISPSDLQWEDVPEGTWFKRIPYLWPVNAPDSLLLNIAKYKTHTMGMSLCAKNLQGTIAAPYSAHCTPYIADMEINPDDVRDGAKDRILANYSRHLLAGIPRWDRPGTDGGLWQETWATRCLDNHSVLKPALNIIEGIYGREGPFMEGPGPDGLGIDTMTNMIIFGKNPFHVDIIGHWLGGHNPGNFGLFHLALERGLSNVLNPEDVPLFEWYNDGTSSQRQLREFPRYGLRTQYLCRDYAGQSEDAWHLVNEPYGYPDHVTGSVTVQSGWNLISLPLLSSETKVSALFPQATSEAYAYNGGYQSTSEMLAGSGYWLKFPNDESIAISGVRVNIRRIPLRAGWNMIGPFESDLSPGALASNPPGILVSPFFGYGAGYEPATMLHSGKAYWAQCSQAGELLVAGDAPLGRLQTPPDELQWMHLELLDADGHHAILHLAEREQLPSSTSLPPTPPSGTFDVRFRGDRYVEGTGAEHAIMLNGAKYPVEIRATNLQGMTLRVLDGMRANLLNAELQEDKPVNVSLALPLILLQEAGTLPLAYELHQNWPNPFNPSTTIEFSLPVHCRVSLVVFNAIGQTVRELVNEEMSAGTHRVKFHARDLASGEYFCRMQTREFTGIRKMLLVR